MRSEYLPPKPPVTGTIGELMRWRSKPDGTGRTHAADGASLHYDWRGSLDHDALVVLAGGAARHPSYLLDLAGLDRTHRLVLPHGKTDA